MRRFLALFAIPLIAASTPPAPAAGGAAGLWTNPHHSVIVRTAPCGGNLCGTIVWASATAQQDARDGGSTGQLVGTELLRDFRAESRGRWSGSVFVPDMGRSFDSTIVQQGPNALNIAGCILHGLLCKHQLWTRAA